MNTLYLCYQSLLEPLTETQVVAYLEGLARGGFGVVLLTFEPPQLSAPEARALRERLSDQGIIWYSRRYHKWPSVPATAWDVVVGIITGLWLIRHHRIRLVHARAHVPGLMGLWLKRLTGVKFLFDVRGLIAEEYADAGAWPEGGWLFQMTKRVERSLVLAADGVVVLTYSAKDLFFRWYSRELAGKPFEVIPCCVRTASLSLDNGNSPRSGDEVRFIYAGKLGGWYPTQEMLDFFRAAGQALGNVRWRVLTQSNPAGLRRLLTPRELEEHISIGRVSPDGLGHELSMADAGLCFYRRRLSGPACSPTKIAEYLAAGLPVVASAGIGDTDSVLRRGRPGGSDGADEGIVGVLLTETSRDGYEAAARELRALLEDPSLRQRCRAVALKSFDLETVGWPRYRQIYERLTVPGRS